MSAFASSSRAVLTRSRPIQAAACTLSKRRFASSSRARSEITIRFANVSAVLRLPSLPEWLSPSNDSTEAMPALAGASGTDVNMECVEQEASGLEWDGVLNAVPKSRVSHSRKAMRQANKGLKDRVNFVHCPGCGRPKLAHHICAECYATIARAQKAALRQSAEVPVTLDKSVD